MPHENAPPPEPSPSRSAASPSNGRRTDELCRADLHERFMIEATLTQHEPVVKVHRPDRDDDDYASLDTFAPRSATTRSCLTGHGMPRHRPCRAAHATPPIPCAERDGLGRPDRAT